MSFPEEPKNPEAPDPLPEPVEEAPDGQVSFPEEPILPEGFTPIGETARLPRSRRRRARRMLVPPGADDRASRLFIRHLAQPGVSSGPEPSLFS